MKHHRFPPRDPREWLNRARSNLNRAREVHVDCYLEDALFDAQQAAEKAIKAVFVARKESFPYSHDLGRLLELLKIGGVKIPKYLGKSPDLTKYAGVSRYPEMADPVPLREYRRLLRIAESVVAWAERQVAKSMAD